VILISADINVLRSSAKRRPMNQHSTPLGIPPRESLLGTVGISGAHCRKVRKTRFGVPLGSQKARKISLRIGLFVGLSPTSFPQEFAIEVGASQGRHGSPQVKVRWRSDLYRFYCRISTCCYTTINFIYFSDGRGSQPLRPRRRLQAS
jgi:hypothetical protein